MDSITTKTSLISIPYTLTNQWANVGERYFISGYQKVLLGFNINLNTTRDVCVRGFIITAQGISLPLPRTVIDTKRKVYIDYQVLAEYYDNVATAEFEIPDDAVYFQIQMMAEEIGAVPGVVNSIEPVRSYNANVIGTKAIERIKIFGDTEDADVETMSSLLDLEGKNALLVGAVLYGRVNGKIAPIFRDPTIPALLVEDPLEYKINNGEHFRFNHYELLATNGTFSYIIETPADKICHLKFKGNGNFHTRIELFEDTTHTKGDEVPSINSNRKSLNVATTKIYENVDDVSDGNLMDTLDFGFRVPSLGPGLSPLYSGGEAESEKMKLKPSSKYLIKVLSLSGDNTARLRLSWYENLEI